MRELSLAGEVRRGPASRVQQIRRRRSEHAFRNCPHDDDWGQYLVRHPRRSLRARRSHTVYDLRSNAADDPARRILKRIDPRDPILPWTGGTRVELQAGAVVRNAVRRLPQSSDAYLRVAGA